MLAFLEKKPDGAPGYDYPLKFYHPVAYLFLLSIKLSSARWYAFA